MIFIDKKAIAERLGAIAKETNRDMKGLSAELGIPYSTLQKYTAEISKPTAILYIGLYNYGINLHWFISGDGDMFRNPKQGSGSFVETYVGGENNTEYRWKDGEMIPAKLGLNRELEPPEQLRDAGFSPCIKPIAGSSDAISIYAFHGAKGWLVEVTVCDVLAFQVFVESGADLVECLLKLRPLAG